MRLGSAWAVCRHMGWGQYPGHPWLGSARAMRRHMGLARWLGLGPSAVHDTPDPRHMSGWSGQGRETLLSTNSPGPILRISASARGRLNRDFRAQLLSIACAMTGRILTQRAEGPGNPCHPCLTGVFSRQTLPFAEQMFSESASVIAMLFLERGSTNTHSLCYSLNDVRWIRSSASCSMSYARRSYALHVLFSTLCATNKHQPIAARWPLRSTCVRTKVHASGCACKSFPLHPQGDSARIAGPASRRSLHAWRMQHPRSDIRAPFGMDRSLLLPVPADMRCPA